MGLKVVQEIQLASKALKQEEAQVLLNGRLYVAVKENKKLKSAQKT